MNLKEQEYVCALAENGTITAAAKELFISQPALSIYINNLEKSLGVRLFERVESSLSLLMQESSMWKRRSLFYS